MQTHHVHLKPIPYELIESGRKKAEIRLYDGKWKLIKKGDRLVFEAEKREPITKVVTGMHKFQSFLAMFEFYEDTQKIFGDEKENIMSRLLTYYTTQQEQEYGVIIVHFE